MEAQRRNDVSNRGFGAHLKRLRVDQNTIMVLMSDNGALKQAARNLPLRGQKLTPSEGGIRVPMIVKWPGVTKAGTINRQYLIIEGIFPTFPEIAKLRKEAANSWVGKTPCTAHSPGELFRTLYEK